MPEGLRYPGGQAVQILHKTRCPGQTARGHRLSVHGPVALDYKATGLGLQSSLDHVIHFEIEAIESIVPHLGISSYEGAELRTEIRQGFLPFLL